MDDGDEPGGNGKRLHPEQCDLCGATISSGSGVYARVQDSSVVHGSDPALDGQRFLTACSPDHLGELQERYRRRPFVNEELWVGKVGRALREHPFGMSEEQLVEATGLNLLQIGRAVAWKKERTRRWR